MNKEGRVLIIDDNQSVLDSLQLFLKYKFKEITTLSNPNQITSLISRQEFDIILLDMNFSAGVNSGNEGLYWLNEITKIAPETIIILITAYGDSELAVKAIKAGAYNFIEKPWNNQKLLATMQAAFEMRKSKIKIKNLEHKQKALNQNTNQNFEFITGSSPAMNKVITAVEKVAQTDANVIVLGENGTGKELIARKIHQLSNRKNEVFMNVDMASLSENLFESELFGHVKGAFTDAKEDRIGKFEAANGGTLFLDEIGNLSFTMQSKLLTALQNRQISKVGSNKIIPLNIRLITATNKNVNQLISENLFREDLLYRINTIQVTVPPLRERKEDILILVNHFLDIYSKHYNKQGLKINNKATEKILEYTWPGNIRELKHTIEKAVILCNEMTLTSEDFFFEKQNSKSEEFYKAISLEDGEKIIIKNALQRNNWNISDTAKELKVGRQTLYRKIEKYDI
ncbi:MAG: sigma-54 dependent transcriptional regulator [Bacteroidales bacterium]|nr:sigma-54 dependent transcriptional regulator [Bacteroidales bacterium]